MKKLLFISFILLSVLFLLRLLTPEDTWLCQKGEWVKHGNPSGPTPTAGCGQQLVGGDRDEHGCCGSCGYSWCPAKNKCLRQWEEPCQ